ncbi:MAG: NADH-quinone oxidoreductase subunit NuoG [Gammaproteobacteria bacterium]|nr:NADH-quinone oxidoreductase subunit G [Rhodocyclaceae bacterium]MBU3908777.1 NADH-quinone oxidoreductase subunit NuoG [Gammaproteobacteria bacterium]MBU3988437.1 NADH-quinone oxidoreductase subunit NuoG [Gammaproteobacteria bacterium]MBU4004805.1 NADH-quinone oxidoreductase subunit NuoG [Gammaproteobacteria bacterium]MBU4021408.1 NADH-quinone oxidoreductase subunit NuoG [Gammaproteobacteria bacterium]
MLEFELDGKAMQVPDGTLVIEAAHQAGIYIPHFCYHKKLSIAANCRMCLVQVEKAPKPMPACATPVTNGMKVFTHSDLAVKAQKNVMEFLLINHPLDCPICDQGGECQLQDLAVGYGSSGSRYQEKKRVVSDKDLGPLVSTDMTRCINCTRCIRFTQEIAGLMELGQAFRGDRAEVMPFIEKTVDSELSGNIIDLCPVGALTSKPFRFSARTWELARRKSVSPHDGLGSNLIVQTQHNRVMRVLPLENEQINECWLSDKERFSYEGLNSQGDNGRLTKPMVKQGGQWQEVDWNVALDYAAHALRDVAKNHGAASIGALVSPHATLEEMALSAKLMRGIGSENIDFRLRQSDFSTDGKRQGAPWLGMKVAEISALDRVLVVGSFLRKDHPLIAQRLRQTAKKGTQVSLIHAADDDLLLKLFAKAIAAPSQLPTLLAEVVKAVAELKGAATDPALAKVEAGDTAKKIATSLVSGSNVGILLGNFAQQHPQAATLNALTQQLAGLLGAKFGFLGEAANSVGGYVAAAVPFAAGMNAAAMLATPRKVYLLLGAEPELDCADGALALAAMKQASSVIMLSPFKSQAALDYADVLLPVAPFSETSGTFVNTEGRVQSFYAVTKPSGEARPAWKVLRVLGNLLELDGFGYESSEQVRDEVLGGKPEFVSGLNNSLAGVAIELAAAAGVERIADVPIHFADALARRAPALQATADAVAPTARMSAAMLTKLGVTAGEQVKVGSGGMKCPEAGTAILVAKLDSGVPDSCVRIAAAHAATAGLGAMFATVTVERA